MSIAVFLSAFLVTAAVAGPNQSAGACAALERQIANYRLSARDLSNFQRVAVYRRNARLDVLPGFPFCDGAKEAVAEVAQDKRTSALLKAGGMSAQTYVLQAWALIIASNPEIFSTGAQPTPLAMANRRFAEVHRRRIKDLLSAN